MVLKLLKSGWVRGATQYHSPNFNTRPENAQIRLLVIHNISLPPGIFEGDAVIDLFLNQLDVSQHPSFEELKDLKVSSHFMIRRDGTLLQFVSVFDRAWHAGISDYRGEEGCNDFSIGIELEGTDDMPYEDVQYQQLTSITKLLLQHFPMLTSQHIVGHSDIAPGRKTDPGGAFDWQRFQEGLCFE